MLCELGDTLVYCEPGDVRHDDGRLRLVPALTSTATSHLRFLPEIEVRLRPDSACRRSSSNCSAERARDARRHRRGRGPPRGSRPGAARHSRAPQPRNSDPRTVKPAVRGARPTPAEPARPPGRRSRDRRARRRHGWSGDDRRRVRPGHLPRGLRRARQPVALPRHSRRNLDARRSGGNCRLHLAVLLENPAYAATFALFLLAETDAERDEVLRDLGISVDDVDGHPLKRRRGVRGREDASAAVVRTRSLTALGREELVGGPRSRSDVAEVLNAAGLPTEIATRLARSRWRSRCSARRRRRRRALATRDERGLAARTRSRAPDADPLDGSDSGRRAASAFLVGQKRIGATSRPSWRSGEIRRGESAAGRLEGSPDLRLTLDPTPAQWLGPSSTRCVRRVLTRRGCACERPVSSS